GQVDLVQALFGLRLLRGRQAVEDVGRLVHPAALLLRPAVDLAQRFAEAERSVANGQLRTALQAAPRHASSGPRAARARTVPTRGSRLRWPRVPSNPCAPPQ